MSKPSACKGRTKIFRRDATGLGDAGTIAPFGLMFADPPYGKGLGETALRSALRGGWLLPGALCVVEESASAHFDPGEGFSVLDERGYGDTVIRFIEAAGARMRCGIALNSASFAAQMTNN